MKEIDLESTQGGVTGDSIVRIREKKSITIQEVYYQRKRVCRGAKLKLRSCARNGHIIINEVIDIFDRGMKNVFKVTTELGYTLTCTLNNQFLTLNGLFMPLEDLNTGKSVIVNGKPDLSKVLNEFGWYTAIRSFPDKIIAIEEVGLKKVYGVEMGDRLDNYVANGFMVSNSTL